jgi:hypothetical protein
MTSMKIPASSPSFLRSFTGAFTPDPSGNLWTPTAASVPADYHKLFEPSLTPESALLSPRSGRLLISAAEDLYRGLFEPNRLLLRREQSNHPDGLFTTNTWRIGQTPDGLEVVTTQFEEQSHGITVPEHLSETLGFVIDNPIERRRVGFSRFQDRLLVDVTIASDRGRLSQRLRVGRSGEPATIQYKLTAMNPAETLPGVIAPTGARLFAWVSDLLARQFPSKSPFHVSAHRVFPNGISEPLFENPLEAGAAVYDSSLMSLLDKALAGYGTIALWLFLRPDGQSRRAQKVTVSKSEFSIDLSNPRHNELWPLLSSAADYYTALKGSIEAGYPVSRNVN